MQFGIFSIGDLNTDPTAGRTPTERERIKAMVAMAIKAEEVGLDVFATGEHHNRSTCWRGGGADPALRTRRQAPNARAGRGRRLLAARSPA
jgi:alkanesulfonate monooxygenase SsuD/methylene tetrahydromethanopterin reductase-like flavin-dependent oxidoreductase (luciferase family)